MTAPGTGTVHRVALQGPPVLDVSLDYGEVRVVASADTTDSVAVRVSPSSPGRRQDVESAEAVRVDTHSGVVRVYGSNASWRRLWRSGGVDIEVEVPDGCQVTATTGYAGVEVIGATSHCSVRSTGGDIRVAQASTGSLETQYGAITVGRVSDGELTVRSTYGETRISRLASGAATVTTSYGGIEVGVPLGTAAYLDLRSDHGRVRSELERAGAPEDSAERASVRARTSYGNITIRRSE